MEELWKHNIEAVNFVLNCTKPSKSTIGSFLLEYEDVIKLFDDFIKKFSVNLGLIEGKTIYWDGTFLKANCNNHKKMYPTQILFLESFIKKGSKYKRTCWGNVISLRSLPFSKNNPARKEIFHSPN